MGLPPGWVTGVPGLKRKEQLRAIGNGVVPQQAAAAVSELLRRTTPLPGLLLTAKQGEFVVQAQPVVPDLDNCIGYVD